MPEFRLVIYDSQIARMSLPGGDIYRWMARRRRAIELIATVTAPKRTGELAGSIRGDTEVSPFMHVIMTVAATADHALFVHEGTGNPFLPTIFPRTASRLRLRAGGGYPEIFRKSVRGQRANPWLREAMDRVMRDV